MNTRRDEQITAYFRKGDDHLKDEGTAALLVIMVISCALVLAGVAVFVRAVWP